MLLALVVWIGGIIFFAFVLAPTSFHVLIPELAGRVVGRSISILHGMGIVSGLVFLVCSVVYHRAKYARLNALALANVLVVIMLALTCISQFRITPEMEAVRPGIHVSLQAQTEFDRLHHWSERLEGGVLFLGLAVIGLTARRFS